MIELPEGWAVRENRLVGFDFLKNGELIFQHPYDSDVARKLAWYHEASKQ